MGYEPQRERIFLGGLVLSGAPKVATPAAGSCASESGLYDWLALDFCASRVKSSKETPVIDSSASAFRFVKSIRGVLRGGPTKEHFIVICLDTKHRALAAAVISVGSLNAAVVHPREAFQPAVMVSAQAVILAHTHPSGDPSPSPEDDALTRRLVQAGDVLAIKVVDHIVVGDEYYSYAESGKLR